MAGERPQCARPVVSLHQRVECRRFAGVSWTYALGEDPLLAPRDVDMAAAVTFWEQTSCRRETLCAPGRPDGRKLLTGHGFPAGDRGLQAAPGRG